MAAAPDDLCTVAELKSWLPNQGNNDDVTLQSLITNASLQVLQYIDRPHILSSVLGPLTENYDGNDSDRLLPRNFPIISVSSVSIDGVGIRRRLLPPPLDICGMAGAFCCAAFVSAVACRTSSFHIRRAIPVCRSI